MSITSPNSCEAVYNLIYSLRDDLLNESGLTSSMKERYAWVIYELNYLNLYIFCCKNWCESPFVGKDKKFGSFDASETEEALVRAMCSTRMSEEEFFELVEKIHLCNPGIKKDCLSFSDSSLECQFSVDELEEFLSSISVCLNSLLIFKADLILDAKAKIESLKYNLDFFKEVFQFTKNWCQSSQDQKYFKIYIEACACRAACVSLLYWAIDEKKEDMAPEADVMLTDLKKKTSPSTPEITRMYLAVLKASKTSGEDSIMAGKLVMKFVERLKDNFPVNPEKDGIQMLFTDLIFLTTFLMDQPKEKRSAEEDTILTEADAAVVEIGYLISSFSSDEFNKEVVAERNLSLHTFLDKVNTFKAKVRKFYDQSFPDSSSCNFPKVNILRFIDSLLASLKALPFCFPKHQIMMLQEELFSLRGSNFKYLPILELQNKPQDIENFSTRIVNLAYNAERAVSSFIFLKNCLWHDILCLSDAIEEIKLIKEEMKRIQHQQVCGIDALNSETKLIPVLPLHANVSTKNIVGFRVQEKELQDQLVSGSEQLLIISIVGMPGLGKTTLAKKIFGDASVRDYFHKCALCTVSQTYSIRRILLDILSDLADSGDDSLRNMEEGDLAQSVHRCLKGRRYLIVIDDIWDIRVWNELKMSFPDDNMGSRIMFTTRIHNLISEAELGHSPFLLNPLSEEESWELLENKLFDQEKCPLGFLKIGKQIARNCKGLPLSIVIIAGVLKEKMENLHWWNQVGKCLDVLINKEGCRDVLELSYNHLPESLKPCFLYFGLFPEDEEIRVKKLIQLWISEGFIQMQEIKSSEVVAEEYLKDLVSRSLVIVTKTSSRGGIKACCVHDLLRDFCIAKGEEENFVKLVPEGSKDSEMVATYAHYRVQIQRGSWESFWRSFLEYTPSVSPIHSILHPRRYLNASVESFPFSNCKFLRVLDIHLIVYEFPEKLVLLRYLAIILDSKHIPPTIKQLENLETLCLYDGSERVHELPITLWEMQKLRHVFGELQLPDDFCEYDIAPLENIQTFSTELYFEQAEVLFRRIPKVQKLKCKFRFSIYCWNLHQIVKLDFLSHLESLHMEHLDSLLFKLRSCAFHFPSTLKKLTLNGFALPWSAITPISGLQNLVVLKLESAFHGKIWNVEDEEFLKLKCLVLRDLGIKELNVSEDSFPCLERLVLERCSKLKMVPSRFGSIYPLKMIRVKYCRDSLNSSVRQIQEEQLEMGNKGLEVYIS